MSFIAEQDARLAPLWETIRGHRFLLRTRDGSIPDEVFARWMRQDYLFVEAAIPFIAGLLPKAPTEHWSALAGVIQALEKELQLFEERAGRVGIALRGAPPAFTCHAYVQFLLATASTGSYAEGYTLLYAAERAYHDSWKVVREGISQDSPWYPFVENWGGDDFGAYVDYLGGELEKLAAGTGAEERVKMADIYRLALLYEIAFWEMAVEDERWPGVEDDLAPTTVGPAWNPDPDAGPEGAWGHMSDRAAEGKSGGNGHEQGDR